MGKVKSKFVMMPKSITNRKKKRSKFNNVRKEVSKQTGRIAKKVKITIHLQHKNQLKDRENQCATVISSTSKIRTPSSLRMSLRQKNNTVEEERISIAEMTKSQPQTKYKVTAMPCYMSDNNDSSDESCESNSDESLEASSGEDALDLDPGEHLAAPSKPVFNKEKFGDYTLYEVPLGAIMLLYSKAKVFLHGICQLQVLYGKVSILGKHLDCHCQKAVVYSPRGFPLLSMANAFETDEYEGSIKVGLSRALRARGLSADIAIEMLMYKVKQDTAILYLEHVTDKCTEFVEANFVQKLYPKMQNNLRCVFRNVTAPDWHILQISPEWIELHKFLQTDRVIMLCGGKSVGKSTLLRYLVNTQLNKKREVYVLDLDPGQPEFTVSGQISLVKVCEPLLGPNFTHLQTPLVSMFIPNINVHMDYVYYLNAVKHLMHKVPEVRSGPLIINCMGITKDIGLLLTACAFTLANPSVVVQIVSKQSSRNFKVNLTPDAVREILQTTNAAVPDGCDEAQLKGFQWVQMSSISRRSNAACEFEPWQVRELRTLAYLSQMLPSQCYYLTERDVAIYQIDLSDISIIFKGERCDPAAANGNIVALCALDKRTCFGWGIVRAVFKTANLLFLLTPIAQHLLEDVRCLMIGSVAMPQSIYFRQHHAVRGHVPYTFKGSLSHFAKTPKRSFLPKAIQNA